MPGNLRTHIFCYDDYRNFSEDVRKRFSDESRYKILSFQVSDELLSFLKDDKEKAFCRVAILGMHDNRDQISVIGRLSEEIRIIDPTVGVILLTPADKIDQVRKSIKFNISAYIPRNANSILRIHNIVKKLISENSIIRFRKRRNLSLSILLIFIAFCILLILFSRLKLPQYF